MELPAAAGPPDAGRPLPEPQRRRGRLVAIASHPFGMILRMAVVGDLAVQALVTLGASEASIGLYAAFVPAAAVLQLPALRLAGWLGKRRLLLATQVAALLAALPLLAFSHLAQGPPERSVPLALLSLTLATAALTVGSTVWWPLLRGFVDPDGTARFFAALRAGWNLALIAFFLGAAAWLRANPGGFGLLFGVAWACGAVRAGLLPLFPERTEAAGALRLREVWRLLRASPPLRRFLAGTCLDLVVLRTVPPFAIVLLRRELGFGEGETLLLTLAVFTGGLLALYPAGRATDRLGPRRVFLATCAFRTGLLASLALAVTLPGPAALVAVIAFGFLYNLGTTAFGVAEMKLLFTLTPGEAPTATLVGVTVIRTALSALAPLAAGLAVDRLLGAGLPPLPVYQGLFLAAAAIQAATILPLLAAARSAPPPA